MPPDLRPHHDPSQLVSLTSRSASAGEHPPGIQRFFTTGFRPMFVGCAAYGILSVVAWILVYAGTSSLTGSWPPSLWHAHEALFGFAFAAVAGFLLTAVPKWTGIKTFPASQIAAVALLWLVGRVVMWLCAWLPWWLVMAIDLGATLALIAVLAPPILAARALRNVIFPALLVMLAVGNATAHLQVAGSIEGGAGAWLRVGVGIIVLMIALISGRIVPPFTFNALTKQGIRYAVRRPAVLERSATLCVVLWMALHGWGAQPMAIGAVSGCAALIFALRSGLWFHQGILRDPLVWVLHVGHGWISVGFALQALWGLGSWVPETSGLHAFTVGAMGTMILGMISRVSLGHTGRPLHTSLGTLAAFLCIVAAALTRVLAPWIPFGDYLTWIVASATLWCVAFFLFLVVYLPALAGPRVDGQPG
ncbi:MAG: NnrS family protein [Nannocystaceae bacterium]